MLLKRFIIIGSWCLCLAAGGYFHGTMNVPSSYAISTMPSVPEIKISGEFHILWKDSLAGGQTQDTMDYILIDNQNQWIRLRIEDNGRISRTSLFSMNHTYVVVKGEGFLFPDRNSSTFSGYSIDVHSIEPKEQENKKNSSQESLSSIHHYSMKWATILCRFADAGKDAPYPVTYFERIIGSEYPGLNHYWQEVSYGSMNLNGSAVSGWHTLPLPLSSYISSGGADLRKLMQDCTAAALPYIPLSTFDGQSPELHCTDSPSLSFYLPVLRPLWVRKGFDR